MKRLVLLLFLFLQSAAFADAPFVPVWLGQGDALSAAELQSSLQAMRTQRPDPDHVVFLIHGYGDAREASAAQYAEISPRIVDQFARNRQKALVVGVQWGSTNPGDMVPWKSEDAYFQTVTRARQVGHVPMRQLLFAVRKQYPRARFDIFAHSLGCEVGAACIYPDMNPKDGFDKPEAAGDPRRSAGITLFAMLGSDMDYDIWQKSKVHFGDRARLLWLSVADYVGERDKPLQYIKMSRGSSAGLALPRMTAAQYQELFGKRALVLDGEDIPQNHMFTRYYDDQRVARLADAACYVGGGSTARPKELTDLNQVMAAPNQVKPLRHWLNSDDLTARFCALWRLEKLTCGGAQHLSDGTIHKVTGLLHDTPRKVWDERKQSKCNAVRAGYWPTEKDMRRAGAPSWAKKES